MSARSRHLPLVGAGGTALLVALPYGVDRIAPPPVTLTVATLCGAVFVVVGFGWARVVRWLYGDQAVVTPLEPTFNQSVDLRFWRFVMRAAYPAFVALGVALAGNFLLHGQGVGDMTVRVGGLAGAVVVLAWFAPLFVAP